MSVFDILQITRPLIFFDLETTGPNPREDRIVSIAFVQGKPAQDGLPCATKEWHQLVNPGRTIPTEATLGNPARGYDGHGITDEMVANAPSFAVLAPHLLKGFVQDTDYGGYNVKSFDLPMIQAEFQRNGVTWDYDASHIIDVFRVWQLLEKRSLSDAAERWLGEQHQGAHDALADIRITIRIMEAMLLCRPAFPRVVNDIHELEYPVDVNAVTRDNKIIWKDGEAVMNFGKKWIGTPLKMMRRADLVWIASPACGGASAEVKRVCEAAAKGEFPVKEAA